MTIATRLDQAMKEAGIQSQAALSRASDIPQPTVNRILKGVGKKGPEAHTIAALAKACNVSFTWLFEGTGPMTRNQTTPQAGGGSIVSKVAVQDDDSNAFVRVPVVNRFLHAGIEGVDSDLEYEDGLQLSLPRQWVEGKRLNPNNLVAIKVKGESMYPTLKDGNTVVIDRGHREPVDGALFAVNHAGKAVVKRLEKDTGLWFLTSDNPLPEFRRRAISDPDTTIVGRVVRMEADFI